MLTRFGQSQSLTIVDATANVSSVDPFQIGSRRLSNDEGFGRTWFGEDFLRLSPPVTVIRALDLSSPESAAVRPLALIGQLPRAQGVYSLCVDEKSFVELADVPHYLIKEIRPVDGR